MSFMQTLKVGDIVGIMRHSYAKYGNVVQATVTKTTKTTITVEWESMAMVHQQVFNISNGRERGCAGSWTADLLISEDDLRKAQAYRHAVRLHEAKHARRNLALKRLQDASAANDDAAFALALEALAQQEYAP